MISHSFGYAVLPGIEAKTTILVNHWNKLWNDKYEENIALFNVKNSIYISKND